MLKITQFFGFTYCPDIFIILSTASPPIKMIILLRDEEQGNRFTLPDTYVSGDYRDLQIIVLADRFRRVEFSNEPDRLKANSSMATRREI